MKVFFYFTIILLFFYSCKTNDSGGQKDADVDSAYTEEHRLQFHFSPKEKWMNDPNGMVYHNGEYHFFYQHYPEGIKWGPMHWGHAISKDLVHWTHLPIALYPDSLGLIFSGSAVVDEQNTTGFGTKENPPLVAIFTYHSMEKEKAGDTDYQSQGIAYSTDNGRTWTKYEGNPVLKNQGIKDFRDPKVFWHDETGKWVMILAVKDHVELWGSADLKSWNKLSDFGYEHGAHGGVWECPDLFKVSIEGEATDKWVMLVSINPGAPNGGSGTQYFTGDFDGTTFRADLDKNTTSWIDYGPDNYAGVTWSDVPDNRRIFLGWMSNWSYAQEVPTSSWRGAATLPRDLVLTKVGERLHLKSTVCPEISEIVASSASFSELTVSDSVSLNKDRDIDFSKSVVSGSFEAKYLTLEMSNSRDQKLIIGFDQKANRFFIDRGNSGDTAFLKDFSTEVFAPRISSDSTISFTLVSDVSSVEVFFDDGLTVMTNLFFPDEPLSKLQIRSDQSVKVEDLKVKQLNSIWKNHQYIK